MFWRTAFNFSRNQASSRALLAFFVLTTIGVIVSKKLRRKQPIQNKTLPLSGINVIDFGHHFAGKAAAQALCDLGATVVSITDPQAKSHPFHQILDRGKKIVKLDLTTQSGRDMALQFVAKSDVVIDDARPGEMSQLGLDFEELCQKHPRLVALSLPPFSKTDTKNRARPATDATLATHTGIFSNMGPNRSLMGIEPSFSPLPLASAYAAVIGSAAIALALQSLERTGYGSAIEVPLGSALQEGYLNFNAIQVNPKPFRYKNLREKEIERRTANNVPFDLTYHEVFSSRLMDPFFRYYLCKNGQRIYIVDIGHSSHTDRVLKATGVYDEVIKRIHAMGSYPVDDIYKPKSQWGKAGSYKTYPVSPSWSPMINELLETAFLQKDACEWEEILAEAGAIGGEQRSLETWRNSKHALAAKLFQKDTDGVVQPGPLAWMKGRLSHPIPPQRVTIEQGLNSLLPLTTYAQRGLRTDPWLKDVQVLDLCNVIAGPQAAGALARFGAHVIKIDPVKPKFDPSHVFYSLYTGQSKDSMLLDITTDAGYEVLQRLIKKSDIIVFNGTTKQIGKLKLDEERIKQINPDAIFCQLDLYGGQAVGPMSNYPGYDDIAQAVCGIAERFGGGPDTPEEHAHLGTLDVMCGYAAVLGIAAAVLHKQKTGESLRARTSLISMGGFLQLMYANNINHKPQLEPSGPHVKGHHALSRFYHCKNGVWIYMDSGDHEMDRLEKIFPGLRASVNKETYLENAFSQEDASFWLQHFLSQDIAAEKLTTMGAFCKENTTLPKEIPGSHKGTFSFFWWDNDRHPSRHQITMGDSFAIRPQYANLCKLSPTEKVGSSTDKILKERLHYSQNEIDQLYRDHTVGDSWGDQYLPK